VDLSINTDPPTRDEIIEAMKAFKNGKLPCYDNLDAELFKEGPGVAATILRPMLTAVREEEKVSDDWCKG
jgi:hypothetical protein